MELAAAFSAEEIQLLYQIALQGRQDIGYAPDDYAGFTMTLHAHAGVHAGRRGAGGTAQGRAAPRGAATATAAHEDRCAPAPPSDVVKKKDRD